MLEHALNGRQRVEKGIEQLVVCEEVFELFFRVGSEGWVIVEEAGGHVGGQGKVAAEEDDLKQGCND